MKRRTLSSALTPLGQLLRSNTTVRVPASIEASPVAFRDWEAAVGTRIAARARPMKLSRGVLTVQAASSTWAQELALLADTITAQLRERGVQVRSLRFRVGEVAPPERPPERDEVRSAPPRVTLPAEVNDELDRVDDEDLRRAIQLAASTNLGWQETRLGTKTTTKSRAKSQASATPQEAPGDAAPATSARPNARAPRSAASKSARPAQTSKPSRAKSPGKT